MYIYIYVILDTCQLMKVRHQAWISSGSQKLISNRYYYLPKFIKLKEPHIRNKGQNKY